ncbi:hypothetical protein A3D42_01795 [Candidatus Nomurabacteria bacterium RIFCSPHIGHO2_02_FULL_41_18]|uniref:DNA polymerase III delta N-terminal domain-containing protein n=1 Tax=Candidatus Nomurabacteria bacterium RIFCSPHIGHO2_02_FULL_41_18 TaxID=1801754 RepID=A0A1F6W872_9BACT|nr:MAG: hypothetical protein A2737_01740 [Candidatus Nomurabacteria bacterium RIFCSPHIGHO2_01_FULL_41_71]OGI77992.1 MAG: hypothetical protein A3D42_01795 [Candidatus Nomurabacteria bacterium RIFCSPHIGHO2_02_FULL_41_18]OGI90271.1 MAG: hypothetical protein A3B01_03120 [Candidatus Nomurabacteria bacterium RIFCSPLOWO2_01_FULL_41_52b]OGJ00150.1 MAG: hypothetical protein A3I90_00885 [Candidatus Nomurabacteria bacterium RIFCSPLOWO2_02_FULL_41_9]
MIYLFSGDDTSKKLSAFEKFMKSLPVGVEILKFYRNNFNSGEIESLYSGSGLFFSKFAASFSEILEYQETRDFVLEKLSSLARSDNFFIFLEGKLGKPVLDAFRKAGAEINVFELTKEKKEKFNNFLVANAFSQKDKLNLWIYFRQAVDKGVGMEELAGVLFWKIKDMLIKKNFAKFSEKELKNFLQKLSYLLPEARKKGRDTESVFERFLLEAF